MGPFTGWPWGDPMGRSMGQCSEHPCGSLHGVVNGISLWGRPWGGQWGRPYGAFHETSMGCPYGELQGVAVGVSLWGALGCGVWDVAMGRPWGSPAHISPQDGTLALGAPGGYYFRGECGPNHCDTAVTVGDSGGQWGTVDDTVGDSGHRWVSVGDTMSDNG